MKKIVLLVLLIAVIGGMVLVPIFQNSGDEVSEDPARFLFEENLAAKWGELIPVDFEISGQLTKVKLIYNDSVFKQWDQLSGKQTVQIDASFYGLGTRELIIEGEDEDGMVFQDRRLLRTVSDVVPSRWTLSVVNKYPHNQTHFTQGLEFSKGRLYQGTGDPERIGATKLGHLDINTGEYKQKIGLDGTYFGEGITLLNDKAYQLTYVKGKCLVYDQESLTLEKEYSYKGEGWGLCNDGEKLYMSNGSERIYVRDPETFEILETIEVYDERGPIQKLNELEFVDGLIYAHVWMTDAIVVIQPENGKVVAIIDATELTREGRGLKGDVQNGIAYRKESNTFFITGKYWPTMFEVSIDKQSI